jgi:hypothetical protein
MWEWANSFSSAEELHLTQSCNTRDYASIHLPFLNYEEDHGIEQREERHALWSQGVYAEYRRQILIKDSQKQM